MNKITNLMESLKLIGFKPDQLGNFALDIPIYLIAQPTIELPSYATLAVMDYDTGEMPTDKTTKVCIAVQLQTENEQDLDTFQIIKEIENV